MIRDVDLGSSCLAGSANLSAAVDDILDAGQRRQPHGAAGVQLLRRNADFSAFSEFVAVGETRRSVDIDGCRIDRIQEALRSIITLRDDGVAVVGAVMVDVCNRFLQP